MQVLWTQACVSPRVSAGTRLSPRAPRQSSFHVSLTWTSPRSASHYPNCWGSGKHFPQVCWYPSPRNLYPEVSPLEDMELLTFHVTWGSSTKQHKNNFHASEYLAWLKVIELGWIISWADHEKTITLSVSPSFLLVLLPRGTHFSWGNFSWNIQMKKIIYILSKGMIIFIKTVL